MNYNDDRHGDVEEQMKAKLRGLGQAINKMIAPLGWVVIMFEFGDDPGQRMNYLSNATRSTMIKMLRELADKLERSVKTGEVGEDNG